jgi:hypothetical protein
MQQAKKQPPIPVSFLKVILHQPVDPLRIAQRGYGIELREIRLDIEYRGFVDGIQSWTVRIFSCTASSFTEVMPIGFGRCFARWAKMPVGACRSVPGTADEVAVRTPCRAVHLENDDDVGKGIDAL